MFKQLINMLCQHAAKFEHTTRGSTSAPALFGYALHQHELQQVLAAYFAPLILSADGSPAAPLTAATDSAAASFP